ncbi:MAG: tRNA (N(6)-L-threonylcarbamoyladenosine(37)-C(2))-methylthiotransferase [Nanoarchaeota archaeon]
MKKVYIKTYGCQANIADSEAMAGLLREKGYNLVNSENEAEYVIINTCSVKNDTQSRELHYLRNIAKTKKVIVGGCLTKTINIRKYVPKIEAVFDTNSLLKLPNILENPQDEFSDKKETERLKVPIIRTKQNIGIIPIGQGCLNKCDFCATKLARGNLVSYRIGDIKRALEECIKDNCKEIYLTSQDNGCYGFDITTNLPELLNELVTVKGDYKIRVGMMNPWHVIKILDSLIKSYQNEKIIKFLHIPVQSGSEKVLKSMKRIHTVENFKLIVNKFRQEFPEISIATDIIVGYPLETDKDFEETLDLIKEIKPEVINISKFSSRHGTEASKLKQLSSQMIDERSKKLNKLYQEIKSKL